MARLDDVLMSRSGEAQVSLSFDTEAGLHVVVGQLQAALDMQCQRCLRPAVITVDRRFRLVMVRSDLEAARLQADHEILEIEGETLLIRNLIEDELLLSVPLVPMHDDAAHCDAAMLDWLDAHPDKEATHGSQSPFAVLKDLKTS